MTRKNFFVKKRQKKDNMLQNILKIIFSDLINYVYTCTKKRMHLPIHPSPKK